MRIEDKLDEIENYLGELAEIAPETLDEYNGNIRTRRACERLFELITEAIADAVFIFIKEREIEMPEDDESAFRKLASLQILPEELGRKLQDARRMRNIIAHKYGAVDDERVFRTIKDELSKDAFSFIAQIKKSLDKK
jgi:uncharacterized protein YutE (UPF0331/DUF86 family)